MTNYSITVAEYAKNEHYNNTMVYSGYYGTGEERLTYTINVLKSDNELIVVDTGYDVTQEEAARHEAAESITNFKNPVDVLKRIGVDPLEVKHVILTHAHWDHMGGISFFPNAKFYLQKDELLNWINIMAKSPEYGTLKTPMSYSNLEEAVGLIKEGRLILLDGDVEQLLPGIDIKVARFGHSFAQNLVYVNTINGRYILSGDTAYVKENFVGVNGSGVSLPNGFAIGSIINTITTMQDMLKDVNGDTSKIIIGHDDKMWQDYKSVQYEDSLHVAYIVE